MPAEAEKPSFKYGGRVLMGKWMKTPKPCPYCKNADQYMMTTGFGFMPIGKRESVKVCLTCDCLDLPI